MHENFNTISMIKFSPIRAGGEIGKNFYVNHLTHFHFEMHVFLVRIVLIVKNKIQP